MNDEILKKMQKHELKILKEFARVCELIGVKYYLDGGTMLGAIRHKGFIPWDDDIDVFMLREDYEKLLAAAPKHLKKQYFLQTFITDNGYLNNFAKIRDNETTFIEKTVKNSDINHGIYIDIFPIDNYDINKKARNFIFNKLINYYILKLYRNYSVDTKKRKLKKFISLLIPHSKKTNLKTIIKKENIFVKDRKNRCKYLRNYASVYSLDKAIFKYEWIGNGKLVDFEDMRVYVPENYDMWLKTIYGDYMKLPPEEKRKPHHDYEKIDFEKSYTEFTK
ncbi:MAG: LicD family protein [Bacilli bacterium]|nr:LicD family protein [Bacilli bacterium]